jgi:hypothetical protein
MTAARIKPMGCPRPTGGTSMAKLTSLFDVVRMSAQWALVVDTQCLQERE